MLPLVLLALVAVGISGPASAQARGESYFEFHRPEPKVIDDATRAAKLAELDAWLRRLAGRFRYDGVASPPQQRSTPANGAGDCARVGAGPGIQCVIQVTWQDTFDPTLAPAMFLYGIDVPELGIRYLQVNSKSIAEGALGLLNGNMATFKTGCVNEPAYPPCRRSVRIDAPPHGRLLWIWDDVEKLIDTPYGKDWRRVSGFMFSLRREPLAGAGGESVRQRR